MATLTLWLAMLMFAVLPIVTVPEVMDTFTVLPMFTVGLLLTLTLGVLPMFTVPLTLTLGVLPICTVAPVMTCGYVPSIDSPG